MKIAVTGANGFIGRHVLPLLISAGHDVTAVVRDKKSLENMLIPYNIVEHEIGINDKDAYLKFGKPDTLLQLAWGGLPEYNSLHHMEDELIKQYHFIKYMVLAGVKNVATTGTCFEYGMQSGPLSEMFTTNPNTLYGYAKDSLRKQLQFLQKTIPFKLTWMRLFYVYGKDQPANTLYSQLLCALACGERTFNMSGGEQLRDYLHIDRVVAIIAQLVLKRENIGIINVCSGKPISVKRLVESWINKNSWDIGLNFGYYPYPDYEPFAFWGMDKKLKKLLEE